MAEGRCCGCLSLRTGVIIIGWISVISCVGSGHAALKEFKHHRHPKGRADFLFITGYMLQIVAGLLLLVGAWQKRAGYLIPFMILTTVITAALAILLLANFCVDYEYKRAIEEIEEDPDHSFGDDGMRNIRIRKEARAQSIAFSITVLINLFFLWVVKSYYNELRKTSTVKSPSLDDVITGEIPSTNGIAPPPSDPSAPPMYPAVPPPYSFDPPPYPGDVKYSLDEDHFIKKTQSEAMA